MLNVMNSQFFIKSALILMSTFLSLALCDLVITKVKMMGISLRKSLRKRQIIHMIESGELPKSLLNLVS
jgi:hypothetical protein